MSTTRLLDNSNGIISWHHYDEDTDTERITYEQDVNPLLDAVANKRNDGTWQEEMKRDFVHFASIPPIVELELLKKGLSLYDKNCTKRLMQEIQTNYPHLLIHSGKKLA